MSKKRKKTSKEKLSITRRDMLKMGAAAGAASVLGPDHLDIKKGVRFHRRCGADNMRRGAGKQSATHAFR